MITHARARTSSLSAASFGSFGKKPRAQFRVQTDDQSVDDQTLATMIVQGWRDRSSSQPVATISLPEVALGPSGVSHAGGVQWEAIANQDLSVACAQVPNGSLKTQCVIPGCSIIHSTNASSVIDHITQFHTHDLPTLVRKLKAGKRGRGRAARVKCPASGCSSTVQVSSLCHHINSVHHRVLNFMCLVCGQHFHSAGKKSFVKNHVVECVREHGGNSEQVLGN